MKKNTVRNYAIAGGVILLVAIAVMVFRPRETTVVEIVLLLAGIVFGASLFRFEIKGWLAAILSLVVFWAVLFFSGKDGLGWIAGYIVGSNFGVAWRAATVDKKPRAPWIVNNQGFDTATSAGAVALEVLRKLDGSRKNWRLSIQNDTARFDASGSSEIGLLCHRTRFGKKVDPWTVLSHPERAGSEVEVPMGGSPGYIPSQYVSNLSEVEDALKKFLEDPNARSWGSEWDTGTRRRSSPRFVKHPNRSDYGAFIMESQKEPFEDPDLEHIDSSSEIMPVWGAILLWIAVPVSLAAVMFGIPWIIGHLLRTMLGTVFLQF